MKTNTFSTKTFFRGEKKSDLNDDNVWDVYVPLKNVICLNLAGSSMRSIEPSNSGGELLPKDSNNLNSEFKFYARRRLNQLNKDKIADLS